MSSPQHLDYVGLPGLRPIREKLGLQGVNVAEACGLSPKWLSSIENGTGDPTQKLQRKLAVFLCCDPADLLNGELSRRRLCEIRISYLEGQLAQERQELLLADLPEVEPQQKGVA